MTATSHSELLGALYSCGETCFRVWAPHSENVTVVFEDTSPDLPLRRTADGYFVGSCDARPGTLYKYELDGEGPWPDPCSRYQPRGVHGPSRIVDPDGFLWTDTHWAGASSRGQVIYELHIGTFTAEGTFDAAIEHFTHLRDLGVTMIEVMPVSECPGRWNWGYDGVQLFAPYHVYGDQDAFKRFVDQAHAHGLAVMLDVVYNHLGPDGNYLKNFSARFFSTRHRTEWGEALNFDDDYAIGARDFVVQNVRYWVREFHVDGFRLDATQSMFDDGEHHIIAQLVAAARSEAAPRQIVITAENEPQCSEHLLPQEQGGFGLDGMWNDDFHHTANVALRGTRDGYFHDYTGRAQEFISTIKYGFLYQGQFYGWQDKPRGSPTRGLPAHSCIIFIDNHDQVANHFTGERAHCRTSPQLHRALTALMLLAPQTPLLFMGQEFSASTPFSFFADHKEGLRQVVHQGRKEFVGQFRSYGDAASQALIPDPAAQQTFANCKLDWSEVRDHAHVLALHHDLLQLRRDERAIRESVDTCLDGATLSETCFVLRWFTATQEDRLLLINLYHEFPAEPLPEPLLAPPRNKRWVLAWGSEDPRYGGHGIASPIENGGRGRWRIAAQSAVLLRAEEEVHK